MPAQGENQRQQCHEDAGREQLLPVEADLSAEHQGAQGVIEQVEGHHQNHGVEKTRVSEDGLHQGIADESHIGEAEQKAPHADLLGRTAHQLGHDQGKHEFHGVKHHCHEQNGQHLPHAGQVLLIGHGGEDQGRGRDVQNQLGKLLIDLSAQISQPVSQIADPHRKEDDDHLVKCVHKIHVCSLPLS